MWKDVSPNPIRRGARTPLLYYYFSRRSSGPRHVVFITSRWHRVAVLTGHGRRRCQLISSAAASVAREEFDAPDDFLYTAAATAAELASSSFAAAAARTHHIIIIIIIIRHWANNRFTRAGRRARLLRVIFLPANATCLSNYRTTDGRAS